MNFVTTHENQVTTKSSSVLARLEKRFINQISYFLFLLICNKERFKISRFIIYEDCSCARQY